MRQIITLVMMALLPLQKYLVPIRLVNCMLGGCGITLTGARLLAAGLLVNNSVRKLYVSDNHIGDDGITAIAEVLSTNQISELYVRGCGITLTGARLFAAGLLVNSSVRELNVCHNSITVEGAHLLVQSAVDNGVCQVVHNDYHNDEGYQDDADMKKLLMILEQSGRGSCYVI